MRRLDACPCFIIIVGVAALSTFGCGGSPNASLAAYCDSNCAWQIKCHFSLATKEKCVSECSEDFGNERIYRTDVFGAVKECFDSLACGKNDDECNGTALFNQGKSDSDAEALFEGCHSKFAACKNDSDESSANMACTYALIVTAPIREAFKTCLAGDCANVTSCLARAMVQ
jgi:hypothetical protein